jgi:glycine/D-amino acid oxidase-like deaminating enzyme
MRRRGLPAAFTRGYFERRGGILHPGRYVRGLRRATLAAGVALHEHTPVVRVEDGNPLVVHTSGGRVRAATVVLATNAYTPELGWLARTVLPIRVHLFATAPLGERERAAIGWPGREGIYTAHEILESYRLTDDGRIVGGAKSASYGVRGRASTDDGRIHAFLERAFRERFPALRDVAITHRWGGPIAFALDFLPVVGRVGSHGTIYHSAGYAGHGVALASYAGRMLVDLMDGREAPVRVLSDRRRIPLPPEPLRWLVFWTLTRVFRAMDARVDRAVRRATR